MTGGRGDEARDEARDEQRPGQEGERANTAAAQGGTERDPRPVGDWDVEERREPLAGGPDNARADDQSVLLDEGEQP